MEYKQIEIKKGIKLNILQTNKFKTNLIAIMLTTKLDRENVTKNALIPAVLKRGTKTLKTQEEINKKLEEMYGASLDCGLDKTGDNQVLKFYIESVSDEFLAENSENMLKESLENLLEFVLNPYLENDGFKKEYVEQEKENLKQIIEGKIDNKARYSLDRCIEEMYKNRPYGLYKYGYIDDMASINEKNLYEYYQKLINTCKIDIFVSGIIDEKIEDIVKNNENIKKLQEREPEYNKPEIIAKKSEKENDIQESMEVTQGKLIIGMDLDVDNEDLRYDIMIYNSIFGGSANSKLFQNVREKASLAYTASSSYYRFKNNISPSTIGLGPIMDKSPFNIFINCGIEIKNYEKALEIIKQQIEDMKNGDFTEEEVENAKKGIIASIKTIDDEQDTEITYFFSQELSKNKCDIEQYMEKISGVTKENVVDIANKVSINTVYFLKD